MVGRTGRVAHRREPAGVPGARGRHGIADVRDMGPDLQAIRLAAVVQLAGRLLALAARRSRRSPAVSKRPLVENDERDTSSDTTDLVDPSFAVRPFAIDEVDVSAGDKLAFKRRRNQRGNSTRLVQPVEVNYQFHGGLSSSHSTREGTDSE